MYEFDEKMANYVRNWGIPEALRNIKDDIIFKFDDDDICEPIGKGYHCNERSVKFCLFNTKYKKILFSMEFYFSDYHAFDKIGTRVQLQFIYTHLAEYRKRGIADYYISKLREYAISVNADCINLTAVPNVVISKQDNGKNKLEINELENFYKKRSTAEMPINVSVLNSN